jgi:hypothetical protein
MVRDFAVEYLQTKDYNSYIHHIHRISLESKVSFTNRELSLKNIAKR